MRRSIALAGIFLVTLGSAFLIFGIWYAWTYGINPDITAQDILFPELSGNLLWLISVSGAAIVLGIIFLRLAHRLSNQFENK